MDVAEISAPMLAVGILFCHIIDEKYKELFIITPFTKNFIKLILLSNFILVCYIVVSAMNGKPNSISNVNLKYPIWRFNRDWLSMQHAILFLSTIWYLIISEIAINYNYLIIYFHFVIYTTFLTSDLFTI